MFNFLKRHKESENPVESEIKDFNKVFEYDKIELLTPPDDVHIARFYKLKENKLVLVKQVIGNEVFNYENRVG